MNFKDKELIIFDLDGTLIDSIPDLTQAVNSVFSQNNLKLLTVEEVTPFVGNGVKKLLERVLNYVMPPEKVTEELFEKVFTSYFPAYRKVVCDKTYLYPGVAETLDYLYNKGYKMTICTNKPVEFIEPILETLSIKQFFELWLGGDSLPQKKPDATPLLHIIEKLEKNIDNSIMVGDSKNDIIAAQNAQMESIGLSYGYNYNESISKYNPSRVVDHFDELQKLF